MGCDGGRSGRTVPVAVGRIAKRGIDEEYAGKKIPTNQANKCKESRNGHTLYAHSIYCLTFVFKIKSSICK